MAKEKWITTGMITVMAIALLAGCGQKDTNADAAADTTKEPASSIPGAQTTLPAVQPATPAETLLLEAPASDFEYEETDGKITINYYKGASMEIAIPAQIDGKDVTVIGDYCFANKDITAVVCPNTLEAIEEFAFANKELKEVSIPASVTEIGEKVFDKANDALVLTVQSGGYAESYAKENNLAYVNP